MEGILWFMMVISFGLAIIIGIGSLFSKKPHEIDLSASCENYIREYERQYKEMIVKNSDDDDSKVEQIKKALKPKYEAMIKEIFEKFNEKRPDSEFSTKLYIKNDPEKIKLYCCYQALIRVTHDINIHRILGKYYSAEISYNAMDLDLSLNACVAAYLRGIYDYEYYLKRVDFYLSKFNKKSEPTKPAIVAKKNDKKLNVRIEEPRKTELKTQIVCSDYVAPKIERSCFNCARQTSDTCDGGFTCCSKYSPMYFE